MNKLALLKKIKRLYNESNVNIIQYLKDLTHTANATAEDIMISYDFQAGTYVNSYFANKERKRRFLSRLAKIISDIPGKKQTLFEPGMGEATTLVPLLNMLGKDLCAGGGDISWSRVKIGQNFALQYLDEEANKLECVLANMFSLPFADASVDIVYTVHAIEPNAGHERELLEELYRVANEYLILLEPAYELADAKAKARMERNGYVRNLYQTAKSLGFNVLAWELYGESTNPLNPTGLMIIEKRPNLERASSLDFFCPVTKTKLDLIGNTYYSKESLLAYPILAGVPCLMQDYAVVATKLPELV